MFDFGSEKICSHEQLPDLPNWTSTMTASMCFADYASFHCTLCDGRMSYKVPLSEDSGVQTFDVHVTLGVHSFPDQDKLCVVLLHHNDDLLWNGSVAAGTAYPQTVKGFTVNTWGIEDTTTVSFMATEGDDIAISQYGPYIFCQGVRVHEIVLCTFLGSVFVHLLV